MPRPSRIVTMGVLRSRCTVVGNCWEWNGSRDDWGYGKIFVLQLKKVHSVHRVAYWLSSGVFPLGVQVHHTCDNPPCFNPFHLWIGTHEDNMADMVAKGRSAKGDKSPTRLNSQNICRGDRNGRRTHPERNARGERCGRTKLTWEKVGEIRKLYEVGDITVRKLAELYGVVHTTIVSVLNGKNWKEEWRPKN